MDNFLGIPLSAYCELDTSNFLAEPLNSISNIAFILAGIGIYKVLKKHNIHKIEYKILFLLVLLVGFGSFLWHATKTPFALLLDALPAASSFALITYIFLTLLTGNKLISISVATLLIPIRFFISSFAPNDMVSSLIRNGINATIFLLIIFWAFKKYGKIALEGLFILGIYFVAIVTRNIDLQICQIFPFGTHFLWHILTALAVYLAVKFIIRLDSKKSIN